MAKHPETELVPYVRGELAPPDRERVARHLDDCPECRQDAEGLRELLSKLASSVPRAPQPAWGGYRAELRDKLAARRARRWAWWGRPLPLALSAASAALAGVLIFFAVWGGSHRSTGADFASVEEAAIGGRLGLLQKYTVVERLDLLEELDVIGNLDDLAETRKS